MASPSRRLRSGNRWQHGSTANTTRRCQRVPLLLDAGPKTQQAGAESYTCMVPRRCRVWRRQSQPSELSVSKAAISTREPKPPQPSNCQSCKPPTRQRRQTPPDLQEPHQMPKCQRHQSCQSCQYRENNNHHIKAARIIPSARAPGDQPELPK